MSDGATPSPLRHAACIPCAKAKRRCSKHAPACGRCARRNLSCRYPPLKITFELSDDLDDSLASAAGFPPSTNGSPVAMKPHPQKCSPESLTTVGSPSTPHLSPWFLRPDSWSIVHPPPGHQQARSMNRSLQESAREIISWLRLWVHDGSCPFIHAHLYRQEFPSCIQHVFTTVATYFTKNAANEELIHCIIEDNCNSLLEQFDAFLGDEAGPTGSGTLHHLARTQALLIYQIIRLFDGDIRLRAQAENSMECLVSWAAQLWESASADAKSASFNKNPAVSTAFDVFSGLEPNAFDTDGSVAALWRAWYVAESVRRTYVIIAFIHGVYETLKRGWAFCPGGVNFTVKKGLWGAPSAHAWQDKFLQDTSTPIESLQLERLLLESQPADIDSFIRPILVAAYGFERVDQWVAQQVDKAGNFNDQPVV